VHMSVEWWGSLHQTGTALEGHIAGNQLFTLFLGFVTCALIVVWLFMHRFRVAWLSDQLAESELADSITARRAEAVADSDAVTTSRGAS